MAAWNELQKRKNSGQEVSTLVNESQLQRNRYYVSSIVDVIKFLVTNELPLRGDMENGTENDATCGLFLQLFSYTMKKDEKLASIIPTIPKTATYTSTEIQNEVIGILATMTQEAIASKVNNSDVPYFTIKVDGMKDAVGAENIAIVLHAVQKGKPFEHVLHISTTTDLRADALTKVIIDTLTDAKLDPNCILAQCYDGASVMAGNYGGVQKILQEALEKGIPYTTVTTTYCTSSLRMPYRRMQWWTGSSTCVQHCTTSQRSTRSSLHMKTKS